MGGKNSFSGRSNGKGIFGREYGTVAIPERDGRISRGSSGDGSFQVKEGAGTIVTV